VRTTVEPVAPWFCANVLLPRLKRCGAVVFCCHTLGELYVCRRLACWFGGVGGGGGCRMPPHRVIHPSEAVGKGAAAWLGGWDEVFEGELVAGVPHGHGCYVLGSGYMYEGQFFKGQPHGWGVLVDPRCAVRGCWWRDVGVRFPCSRPADTGVPIVASVALLLCVCMCVWVRVCRHVRLWVSVRGVSCTRAAYCLFVWAPPGAVCVGVALRRDVTLYEGEFADGDFNGLGTFFFDNGDVYHGRWRQGLFDGKGEYTSHTGTRCGARSCWSSCARAW
jgi:hypothetical protein